MYFYLLISWRSTADTICISYVSIGISDCIGNVSNSCVIWSTGLAVGCNRLRKLLRNILSSKCLEQTLKFLWKYSAPLWASSSRSHNFNHSKHLKILFEIGMIKVQFNFFLPFRVIIWKSKKANWSTFHRWSTSSNSTIISFFLWRWHNFLNWNWTIHIKSTKKQCNTTTYY